MKEVKGKKESGSGEKRGKKHRRKDDGGTTSRQRSCRCDGGALPPTAQWRRSHKGKTARSQKSEASVSARSARRGAVVRDRHAGRTLPNGRGQTCAKPSDASSCALR